MIYDMDIRVRYSELGSDGYVTLHQFLDYFQDCSTFHSEDIGYGYERLLEEECGWFLLAYDIEISRYPRLGEHITVRTCSYKIKGYFAYRRFYIYDEEGVKVADADSLWICMNLQKMLPIRPSEEMNQAYTSDAPDLKVRVKRKLSEKGDWELREVIPVNRLYLDSNSHVNNGFYCLWAEHYLKSNEKISKIRIDYRKSSFEGDELKLYTYFENETLHVKFINQKDELVAIVEMIDKE